MIKLNGMDNGFSTLAKVGGEGRARRPPGETPRPDVSGERLELSGTARRTRDRVETAARRIDTPEQARQRLGTILQSFRAAGAGALQAHAGVEADRLAVLLEN